MLPHELGTAVLEDLAIAGAGRPRIKHAEDPGRDGYALCGIRLRRGSSSPAGDRCAVCRDLTSRSFWVR